MNRAGRAARITADIVVNLARQVVVEPIRTGRLRADGWPAGVRTVVGIGIATYLAGLTAAVLAPVLRGLLRHDNAVGFPDALLPVGIITIVIILGVAVTGALHAVWPIRGVALLLTLTVDLNVGMWSTNGAVVLVTAFCWLPLVGFVLWRGRRGHAWWEYVVVQVLVAAPVTVAGSLGLRRGLASGSLDEWSTIYLLISAVIPYALPLAMLAGLAVAEVAFTSSVWLVETISVRVPAALMSVLALVLGIVCIGSVAWYAHGTVLSFAFQRQTAAMSAIVLGLTLAGWLLVDRIADRSGADSTVVHQLVPRARLLGAGVSLIVMLPPMILLVLNGIHVGLGRLADQLGIGPIDLTPTGPLANVALLRGIGNLTAGVLATVGSVLLARRGRRGIAELSMIMGIISLERGLRVLGWLPAGTSTALTGALASALIIGLAVTWLVRRRLTPRRVEAIAAAFLLVLALTHRDLLSDPLSVLLGAGGALLAFGLIWSLLTGAEDANGDSARFPRSARAMLVTANLALVMVALGLDQLAERTTGVLEPAVTEGAEALGDPLIIAGLWAVLAAAWRNEEVLEAAPRRGAAGVQVEAAQSR